ncbi:MAG TPA: flagellar biosynthesis protein FlhF [Methylibium sp.]|nr:flagellar biosynthesis protein FlhF [Methylibium sp.]
MNFQRYTGKTSRDAMVKVRQALGADAVVLSTKPCAEGIEILAMAPGALAAMEREAEHAPQAKPRAAARVAAPAAPVRPAPLPAAEVSEDVEQLSMSTLSFQDYVRERMLKKRDEALRAEADLRVPPRAEPAFAAPIDDTDAVAQRIAQRAAQPVAPRNPPVLRDTVACEEPVAARPAAPAAPDMTMINELRAMKGLIEERFGALAFMEKLQRQPAQARLTQKLLDCGFSPALIRKLVEGLGAEVADEQAWAAGILERNLLTGEHDQALEDQGGVFALIGSTGVGKTTSTAKLAAAFAAKHGAGNLGLITLDAYRVAAHEQLRAYGRILGVPVHTAHDRTALEDLLDLLSAKKMVLIDTAGVAQRDARTKELLEMLGHRSIQKLLVVNAASQGETIDDVMISYRAAACKGVVLSKLDEAVKLAPALDAVIRHRQKIVAVANGQRVPEDWHRLSAQGLVHRALRAGGSPAYLFDASEMNLVFAAPQPGARAAVL